MVDLYSEIIVKQRDYIGTLVVLIRVIEEPRECYLIRGRNHLMDVNELTRFEFIKIYLQELRSLKAQVN